MANTDIFQRKETSHEGSFSSDSALLTLSDVELGVVQNANFQYTQNVNRVYGIGTSTGGDTIPIYYIGGQTQGQMGIGRILGPKTSTVCGVYSKLGGVCNPKELELKFGSSTCSSGGTATGEVNYTLKSCIMTNVGVSLASQDMLINENMQFIFATATCNGK